MISGKEFNEKCKGIKFVKLTNSRCRANEVNLKEGLNESSFNTNPAPGKRYGGFSIHKFDDFGSNIFDMTKGELMEYMWDVEIPDDANVKRSVIRTAYFDKIILSNKRYIWDNNELCLEAVKKNYASLQYVKNQTESLCLEAVKSNPYALSYVENKTDKILEEVLKHDSICSDKYDLRLMPKRPSKKGDFLPENYQESEKDLTDLVSTITNRQN